MSKIKGDINREMMKDSYGDGTTFEGVRSKDSSVKTYTVQELAYSKGVPEPAREALLAMQEKLSNYIKIHDAVVTDSEIAYERIKELEEELARVKENLRIEREIAVRDQKRIAGITAICKQMFT